MLIPNGAPSWVEAAGVFVDMERPEVLADNTGLFLEAAALRTPDDLLAFTKRYGSITYADMAVPFDWSGKVDANLIAFRRRMATSDTMWDSIKHLESLYKSGVRFGTYENTWNKFLNTLSVCVALWKAFRDNDINTLKELIGTEWDEDKQRHCYFVFEDLLLISDTSEPISYPEAARKLIGTYLDECAHGGMSPTFSKPTAKHRFGQIVIEPSTLESAIWLQFALAVTEDKSYRTCAVCGRAFELSPQTARSNRLLCSEACKFKGYRQRQTQAIRLHRAGRDISEISTTLGVKPESVTAWIVKELHRKDMSREAIAATLNMTTEQVAEAMTKGKGK